MPRLDPAAAFEGRIAGLIMILLTYAPQRTRDSVGWKRTRASASGRVEFEGAIMGGRHRRISEPEVSRMERAVSYVVWTAFGTICLTAVAVLAVAMLAPARIPNF